MNKKVRCTLEFEIDGEILAKKKMKLTGKKLIAEEVFEGIILRDAEFIDGFELTTEIDGCDKCWDQFLCNGKLVSKEFVQEERIKKVTYTSVWNSREVVTHAKFNSATGEVFDIEVAEAENLDGICESEYITWDGISYGVECKDGRYYAAVRPLCYNEERDTCYPLCNGGRGKVCEKCCLFKDYSQEFGRGEQTMGVYKGVQICMSCGHEWDQEFDVHCPSCGSCLVTDFVSKGIGLDSSIMLSLSRHAHENGWSPQDTAAAFGVDIQCAEDMLLRASAGETEENMRYLKRFIHQNDIKWVRRLAAMYRVLILGINGVPVRDDNCCECGCGRFYGHQMVRMDVIVDENGEFCENLPGGIESAIYDHERPYGQFTCWACGKEYEELPLADAKNQADAEHHQRQEEMMAQDIVGEWESKKKVPYDKRLTYWFGDYGMYAPKFDNPKHIPYIMEKAKKLLNSGEVVRLTAATDEEKHSMEFYLFKDSLNEILATLGYSSIDALPRDMLLSISEKILDEARKRRCVLHSHIFE